MSPSNVQRIYVCHPFGNDRKRGCVVDGATPVGVTIAQIFTGLVMRQFGEDAFSVDRVDEPPPRRDEQVAN